jgi:hypothetical protein
MGHAIALIVSFLAGIVVALLAILLLDPRTSSRPKTFGEFLTTPKAELLDDGRALRLLEDFVYVDPDKKPWIARKDLIVDGATIPRVFWSVTGGPLEGQFRNASIVHDEACDRMADPWEDVHLMFYNACRCGGLPETKAKILYAAVYHFGPRWAIRTVAETRMVTDPDGRLRAMAVERTAADLIQIPAPSDDVRQKIETFVNNQNPGLDDLRAIDPGNL